MESELMTGHASSTPLGPRRILVRGVNWLGDAVMTTPALLRLRERFPQAHIALLTPEPVQILQGGEPIQACKNNENNQEK